MSRTSPRLFAAITIFGAACRSTTPSIEPAAPQTVELARAALHAAAASDDGLIVSAANTVTDVLVEARRAGAVAWTRTLTGRGGPLVATRDHVVVVVGGHGDAAGGPVRGEPGLAVVAIDRATGAVRWRIAVDAGGWASASAIAALPDGGVVIGGSFTGTLRAGSRAVGSGGKSDGFVLRLGPTGQVAWLVRVGGVLADSVQGVAARGERIAIAGTFQATAEVLGAPLAVVEERSPYPDGFVAELTGSGERVWATTFGGPALETVVGAAIDAGGKVVVAANATGDLRVGSVDLSVQGPADGIIGWWNADGTPHHAAIIGSTDFDGLRGIAAAGPSVVVGGFYAGSMSLGGTTLTAGGGDDAFLVAVDDRARIVDSWVIGGPGREDIMSITSVRGGVVVAAMHTDAANVAGAQLAAPADPLAGSVVIVRGVR